MNWKQLENEEIRKQSQEVVEEEEGEEEA